MITIVTYKSQNKNELIDFQYYLKDNVDNETAKYAWEFYYKHLYLDDLNNYVRIKTNKVINTGYGNYNASVVLLFKSFDDKKHIDFFKAMIENLKIDFNKFYVTSYNKHVVNYDSLYEEVINLEVQAIKPKIIFSIGDYNLTTKDSEIVIIDRDILNKMLELSSKENLTDEESKELVQNKKILWQQLKLITKYIYD